MVYTLVLLSQLLLAVFVVSNGEDIPMFGVVDKPLTLSCPLAVSETPQLKWKDWVHTDNRHAAIIFTSHGNTNRVPNDRHSQSDNYEIDDKLRLTIKQFRTNDVGQYACESTVNKTKSEQKFSVSAVGDFKCEGMTADVNEGEPLDLKCHATYRGQLPTMAWYIGETETESQQEIDFGTADYTVNSAGQPDMNGAKFTCRMIYGQDMVEECDVTVTVQYTVRNLTFNPSKTEYNAKEKVEVTAQGNPTPKVKCILPGDKVVQGDGKAEFTVEEKWIGETNEIECTAMNSVDGTEEIKTKSVTFKTSGHKPIAEPTAKAKAGDKTAPEPKQAEAKPEPEPAGASGDDKSMIIIICIIVAVVVLIIIVVAVVCVRRKNSQKRQRLPTKEEEVRRLEDGKGGESYRLTYTDSETRPPAPDHPKERDPRSLEFADLALQAHRESSLSTSSANHHNTNSSQLRHVQV